MRLLLRLVDFFVLVPGEVDDLARIRALGNVTRHE